MNKKIKTKLKILVIASISGILGGVLVGVIRGLRLGDAYPFIYSVLKGLFLGFLLASVISFFEHIVLPDRLKKKTFFTTVLIKSVIYTVLVICIFLFVSYWFRSIFPFTVQMDMLIPAVLITFFSVVFFAFFISINRILGPRILINFFLGKYHNPVEEQRIFMFLDLVSSTTIAEKFGHVEFHRFLNEFFFDINDALVYNKAEIYKYVGDEVIAVWKVEDEKSNRNCINCYFDIQNKLAAEEVKYNKMFGILPSIRVGIHCGTVVSGEMGDAKQEIVYVGDVVNTASRIQAETKKHNRNLLVSRNLLDIIEPDESYIIESIGFHQLRGKEESIELAEIKKK